MSAERFATAVLVCCAAGLLALGASVVVFLLTTEHLETLLGLARANVVLGALGLVLATGAAVASARSGRPVRRAALACGCAVLSGGLGTLAFLHWFLSGVSLSGPWR